MMIIGQFVCAPRLTTISQGFKNVLGRQFLLDQSMKTKRRLQVNNLKERISARNEPSYYTSSTFGYSELQSRRCMVPSGRNNSIACPVVCTPVTA